MTKSRKFLAISILAFYFAQVVAGRALHLWQHQQIGHNCCCEFSFHEDKLTPGVDRSSGCLGEQTRKGCCAHHAGEPEAPSEKKAPSRERRHDSSNCQVCKVLGQAQDAPTEFSLPASWSVLPAPAVLAPDFFPTVHRSGVHTRAPPVRGHLTVA